MKQQHHPHKIITYAKGADRDLNEELFDANEGVYRDACNMRTTDVDGDAAVAKKMKGEELLYPNVNNACNSTSQQPLSDDYFCMGTVEVNGNIVEIWADQFHVQPSLIRVNGIIVLKSPDFPIDYDYPPQLHKNDACIGGEIYITDYHSRPLLFNVKDLLLNSGINVGDEQGECTEKYFTEFNIEEHYLVLYRALDHPVFIKLDSGSSGYDYVLGSGGMPVGYYTYAFRYVTDAGDRTEFSAPTPQIPVLVKDSSQCSPTYPSSMAHSKDADISSPTTYGVHIRLRINNENNYDYIEVLRCSWNAGDPLNTPPIRDIVGKIDINPQDIKVLDILDMGDDVEETLGEDEGSDVMATIERAKAIRYFNSRLYLMNVEYGSRNVDDLIQIDGTVGVDRMYPSIQHMGKDGHSDPHKYTYYKSYMHNEKYGFGVFVWDGNGNRSFIKEIGGYENYEFPSRRDETSALTEDVSYKGTVRAATTDIVTVGQTHEVFDLSNAVGKSNKCLYHNIMEKGNKHIVKVNYFLDCPKAEDEGLNGDFNAISYVLAEKIGYRPFTPTSQSDSNCASTDYRVNINVRKAHSVSPKIEYNPKGFAPDYYSLGMALKGVSGIPSWANAFSIVRTEPAKRVVAQGVGFYSLISAGGIVGANTRKYQSRIAVFFPDIDPEIGIDPLVAEDIQNNPTSYEIQLVSPLGFFTEVYAFNNIDGLMNNADHGIDMISYARIIRDLQGNNAEINPQENPNMGIQDGSYRYVTYSKWRSDSYQGNMFTSNVDGGNRTFDIVANGFNLITEGRGNYYEIDVDGVIYENHTAGGQVWNNAEKVQNWHEPVYIVNIIKKNADIGQLNIQTFVPTGHYQKVFSEIGKGDFSSHQEFMLVDERWEDCIDKISFNTQATSYDSLYRFAYIKKDNGDEFRWLCVSNLTNAQITAILNDLQANGVAQVTDSSGTYQVYGVYTHNETVENTAEVFTLVFDWFNTSYDKKYFSPDIDDLVLVRYDNRIPIRFFGGDTGIGEAIFALKDKLYGKSGTAKTDADKFRLNIAFPYMRYELNSRIYQANKTKGVNKIQDKSEMKFEKGNQAAPAQIRQLCVMATVSSRTNLSYAFNIEAPDKAVSEQYFPLVNYIMRPYEFSDDKFGQAAADIYDDNNIQDAYEVDYGDEWQLWGYGGFRFLQQVNIDYSKDDNSLGGMTSVPNVGYEEQNLYCTRVVWSERRPPNIQDTPTVRTFPSQNYYDIADDTGEIKFAYDDISGKGINLYAITNSGVCLLLVDKRIISEINANELATVGSDIGGILEQLWLNKDIGMSDEMWRSAAEYSNQLFFCNYKSAYKFSGGQIEDIGRKHYYSRIYDEILKDFAGGYSDHVTAVYNVKENEYWVHFRRYASIGDGVATSHYISGQLEIVDTVYDVANDISDGIVGIDEGDTVRIVYCSGSPVEIIIGGDNNNLLTVSQFSVCNQCGSQIILKYNDGSTMVTIATVEKDECYCISSFYSAEGRISWLAAACSSLQNKQFDCATLIYGVGNEYWQGGSDYSFDKFLSVENKVYGMRDMETYELQKGYLMNGQSIISELVGVCAVEPISDKEFIRIRCNSDNKPSRIEFFNTFEQLKNNDVQATLLDTDLKDYYGYEQYIPRKTLAPNGRMQGREIIYRIVHDKQEDFKVITTDIQYKKLK